VALAARIIRSLEGTDPSFVLQQLATRLRGFETDPFGSWLSQRMIELSAADVRRAAERDLSSMIDMRDSLDLRPEDLGKFDLVIGNPPYGRISLPPERRRCFARSVYGHANLYGLFTDAAIRWTKSGGVVAYVTPTSMLSGLYFKSLRALLATEAPPIAVNFIDEREGIFADVLQETMLTTYRRDGLARGPRVGFIGKWKIARTRRSETFAMPTRPNAPWLLPRAPEQSSLTRRLCWMPHRLKDYGYEVSTGPLVWNRHKKQFRSTHIDGVVPVIWAESITSDGEFVWRSEKRNHLPWLLPRDGRDDWLVVDRPCVLLQRTTAKEQDRRLIAAELPKSFIRKHNGVTVENHVNMIRPAVAEPKLSPAVLAVLFNSAAVDAAFRCINGSVAVSAFELEELPLPSPAVMDRLNELCRREGVPRQDRACSRPRLQDNGCCLLSLRYRRSTTDCG
jgi:adenine-specific DNA-methyltransferase